MFKNKISLVTCAVLVSAAANANEDSNGMADMIQPSSFKYENNMLVEKVGDDVITEYKKADLPANCKALKVDAITEQHTQQPSSDIVGTWQAQYEAFEGEEIDWSSYITIASNGQLTSYEVDKECYVADVSELDGNKRPAMDMGDFDVEVSKIKLTSLEKQLAVITEQQETFDFNGKKESYDFLSVVAYDKAAQLPNECDVQAVLPRQEASKDNPNSAHVGIWQAKNDFDFAMDDDMDGGTENSMDSSDFDYQEYFVVTSEGFIADAVLETYEGATSCQVNYIGEAVGDLYKK